MSNIVPRPVNSRSALGHFRSILEMNGEAASEKAMEALNLGAWFVLAPADTNDERLNQLSVAGILPQKPSSNAEQFSTFIAPNAILELIGFIDSIQNKQGGFSVLIREPYLTRAEMGKSGFDPILVGSSAYKKYALRNEIDIIRSEIDYVFVGWNFAIFIGNYDETPKDLGDILINAAISVVTAYDGEGFLLWTSNKYSSCPDVNEHFT